MNHASPTVRTQLSASEFHVHTDHRGHSIIRCQRCGARWTYPRPRLSVGSLLRLTDHAASHKLRRPTLLE